jgi:lipopolysaccharide assembly outer membrane protein LptD (OstA)
MKKKIELIYADEDNIIKDKETGKDIHHVRGKVKLIHNDIIMLCDSAHFAPDNYQVTAFSRIHIEQGDTLDLIGDYLFYDGKSEIANVKGNVELIDKETHLFTDAIDYDVKNKIARYNDKGRITNADNTLTSIIGIYYVSESLFHFKDSVKIVNPDYVMTADTMDYNTKTETSFFTGPTELNGDSIYLYCRNR